MTSFRLALAAAVLPLLSACTAVVPVEVSREVALESPGGAFTTAQPVDLAQQATLWSHRDQVDAISVDEITATVVTVGAGHLAPSVSLSLRLRPDGAPSDGSQDLDVGTLASLPFVAGQSVTLHGSAALDAFLLQALHGSGKFTTIASGSLGGPANAVVDIALSGSASYQVLGK